MAWPKLRNRRSRDPKEGGTTPEVHVAPAASSGGQSSQRWPGSRVTVTPAPVPVPAPAPVPEAEADDAPFWESWAPADESISLDDPGDGLPEEGPADDGVTDVDPRPRPSWQPVVASAGDSREQPQAEGIGQHLGSLAHLSGHPRMRVWRRRIIVAVVFGVGFGYWLGDWRLGLTFAVLAAIADAIIRSRTTFNGPAGVRLNGAQKRTVRQLSSLERKGYRSMHIVPIPGSDEQIDHLVFGPAGVFAIDSEDWDRRMPVRTSSHKNLWHGPRNMKDRLEHAHWEADQAAVLLSEAAGRPVTVRPVLAVYGPKIMWDVAEIRDVDTFSGPRLRKYLRKRAKKRDAHMLSRDEVERIYQAAQKAFPQAPTS